MFQQARCNELKPYDLFGKRALWIASSLWEEETHVRARREIVKFNRDSRLPGNEQQGPVYIVQRCQTDSKFCYQISTAGMPFRDKPKRIDSDGYAIITVTENPARLLSVPHLLTLQCQIPSTHTDSNYKILPYLVK